MEQAVKAEWESAHIMLSQIATNTQVGDALPDQLQNAVFCGHLVADLDSIAGAIGAAQLYGGKPARASDINSETEFALQRWGISLDDIPPVEKVIAENGGDSARVCLVDFQQTHQLNPAIKESQIVGVIDHHALQSSTIVTAKPIFVDIRPWGSMSSIIAHSYVLLKKHLEKSTAGLLLCAILSDTLNLRSPTTTSWDRKIVSMLVQYTGVEDVNLLCAQQFKAKSHSLSQMSAYALCSGDLKQFKLGKRPVRVAFAVVETTDASSMLARVSELVPEIVAVRAELSAKDEDNPIDAMFLAIVDIVDLQTHVICSGQRERSLAAAAGFDAEPLPESVINVVGCATKYLMRMAPNKVSRKADFIPPLTTAVENGWTPQGMNSSKSEVSLEKLAEHSTIEVEYSGAFPGGKMVRKISGLDEVAKDDCRVQDVSAAPSTVDVLGEKRKRDS